MKESVHFLMLASALMLLVASWLDGHLVAQIVMGLPAIITLVVCVLWMIENPVRDPHDWT